MPRMSASAPALPAALAGKVPPLALPVGSVRALITLSTLGTVWFHQFQGLPIPPVLGDTLLLVLGYYFGIRNAAPPAAADALAAAPAADRESNRRDPLFLPRGMIRILIIVGFAAIGMKLFNDGKLEPSNPPPEFALLGGFLGASLSRGGFARIGRMLATKITNLLGHLLATTTLAVVLGYCAAAIAGFGDWLTTETTVVFAGVVGFYMGKR
jgi:hypothetical protein